MGDRLLRVLADELRQCVRESDTVARLGGDEFTILLARVSGEADAVQDQIGDRIDAVVDLGEKGGPVGSTIIDATGDKPVILRPGRVSREEIERKTGLQTR